ncbi:hypothetical protein CBL_11804 [Carabus blaptoides fortunei]
MHHSDGNGTAGVETPTSASFLARFYSRIIMLTISDLQAHSIYLCVVTVQTSTSLPPTTLLTHKSIYAYYEHIMPCSRLKVEQPGVAHVSFMYRVYTRWRPYIGDGRTRTWQWEGWWCKGGYIKEQEQQRCSGSTGHPRVSKCSFPDKAALPLLLVLVLKLSEPYRGSAAPLACVSRGVYRLSKCVEQNYDITSNL